MYESFMLAVFWRFGVMAVEMKKALPFPGRAFR
jgi:hypothetical protein